MGFTLLVVGVIIAFGLLSQWQWHRAEERDIQRRDLIAHTSAPAVDVMSVIRGDNQVIPVGDTPDWEWQPVELTGTYDTAQFVVRRRPLDGRNGFWVLSRLVTDVGGVWVNRGWIPADGDALALPEIPAPPPSEVTIRGYLRSAEPVTAEQWQGVPTGMVPAIAPSLMAASSILPGYVQLAASDPRQADLVILPLPEIDTSRNISYAVQWILFALVAGGGWLYMLRREARTARAEANH